MMLLTVNCIIQLMKSDLVSYSDNLQEIENNKNYFKVRNKENQKYWTDWFCGSDMGKYN